MTGEHPRPVDLRLLARTDRTIVPRSIPPNTPPQLGAEAFVAPVPGMRGDIETL